jgi:hypothetical protein
MTHSAHHISCLEFDADKWAAVSHGGTRLMVNVTGGSSPHHWRVDAALIWHARLPLLPSRGNSDDDNSQATAGS